MNNKARKRARLYRRAYDLPESVMERAKLAWLQQHLDWLHYTEAENIYWRIGLFKRLRTHVIVERLKAIPLTIAEENKSYFIDFDPSEAVAYVAKRMKDWSHTCNDDCKFMYFCELEKGHAGRHSEGGLAW